LPLSAVESTHEPPDRVAQKEEDSVAGRNVPQPNVVRMDVDDVAPAGSVAQRVLDRRPACFSDMQKVHELLSAQAVQEPSRSPRDGGARVLLAAA
jgi:hypothetical protein